MIRPAARHPALALGAILLATACDDPFSGACTLDVSPAIEVVIVDAVTEAPLAEAARGIVRDGAYADSLQPWTHTIEGEMASRAAALGRPGRYDVEVAVPGYVPWLRLGVLAPAGRCGVETTALRAILQPSSPR